MSESSIKEIENIYKTSIDEMTRTIEACDKKTEFVVKKIPIKIPLKELQKIFGQAEDDPMFDVYDVFEKEAKELEEYTNEKIELNKFDCQIGTYEPKK